MGCSPKAFPSRQNGRIAFRSVEAGAFRSVSALWRKLHIHFPASPYRITTTSLGRDARGEKAPHGPDHPLLPLPGNSPCPFPRSSLTKPKLMFRIWKDEQRSEQDSVFTRWRVIRSL